LPQPRERNAILVFIVLALGFSICYWAEITFLPKETLPSWLRQVLWGVLRGFGPALAAVVAWYYANGRSGLRDLASRALRWKISRRMYLLALVGPFTVTLIVIVTAVIFGKMDPHAAAVQPLRMLVLFFAMAIADGPLGEELGWRGLLLPKILEKSSALWASLLVGTVWYAWHLPLYIADGRDLPVEFFFQYWVSCTALSFIFTWFFLRTQESALFAVLLHNTSNYSIYMSRLLFPNLRDVSFAVWIYTGLLVAAAIAAGISMAAVKRRPGLFRAALE